MGMILRIASSRIVGQGDIVGRSGYFSLNLCANSVMRGRLDASRTLKSLVADLRIIKLVNMLPVNVNAELEFPLLKGKHMTAVKTVLVGRPDDKEVHPISENMDVGEQFLCESPAYSFIVIRIPEIEK